jgi:hypothetical protein
MYNRKGRICDTCQLLTYTFYKYDKGKKLMCPHCFANKILVRGLDMEDAIVKTALKEYIDRSRGDEFPEGEYDEDGEFKALPSEACPMCAGLEADPEVTPEMYYTHCLTSKHIALKYGLDVELFGTAIAMALGCGLPEDISGDTRALASEVRGEASL